MSITLTVRPLSLVLTAVCPARDVVVFASTDQNPRVTVGGNQRVTVGGNARVTPGSYEVYPIRLTAPPPDNGLLAEGEA